MPSSDDYENLEAYSEADIAIVGMALRVPGALNLNEFWSNLRSATSSIRRLSIEELDAAGESPSRYSRPNYVPFAADLPNMEMFDADFFGLSPKEAAIMDPQQRQFLECAWEALEDAARPPESIAGPVGVFAGCGMGSYFYFNICSQRDLVDQVGMFLLRHTGNDKDFLATRVSYTFDLQGPSVNVQTACSTSLVAVHYACQSLLSRESDMALAGGVTIELPHRRGYLYAKDEILSPDGCCRAFDHRAAGTVFGSGVGVVVLRRLADAIADGDPIHAVIKGTAVNNDGRAKATYLAPSVDGQARAIIEAQGLAGVLADKIGYVECHGTGTVLGDPIEIEALTHAFRQSTSRTGFCRVGSVKTNIGHLDTAAGVVGLIKAALALEHEEVPPTLCYEAPNPEIDFGASPFVVNDRLTPWLDEGGPRFAAVNSLGVGGTNAHAVLQDAPRRRRPAAAGRPQQTPTAIVLSARSRKALDAAALSLAAELDRTPDRVFGDVAHTLVVGRRSFEHRRTLAARSPAEAAALLRGGDPKRVHAHSALQGSASAVFLFPGGGAQHPGMAKRLYKEHADFRGAVDEGLAYLPTDAEATIRALWLGADADRAEAARAFLTPSRQLPAILIVEVALARLWMSRGVRPSALIGHSMGENSAACVAGVLSFQDAVGLVRLRGELFDTMPGGGMLSVVMAADALSAILPAELDVASINAPELCVVSGPALALDRFQEKLEAAGVDATRVAIDIAAHSRMLDPILGRFEAYLRTIRLKAPEIPIVSNVSGDWLSAQDACDPGYWRRHLRSTVRFGDGLATLASDGSRVYVEVGPGKTLSSLVKAQRSISANAVINSLPHADEADADDHAHMVAALARGWAVGLLVELEATAESSPQRVRLPSYPFQRQRYFYDRAAPAAQDTADAPVRRPDIADWGYAPAWRQTAPERADESRAAPHTWLIFLDEGGVGADLAERLREAGDVVASVRLADQFARRDHGDYALCPEGGRPGYDALFSALKLDGLAPDRILHLWLLTADEGFRPGSSFFHRNQERGFFSMLHLAQALGQEGPAQPVHVTVVTNGMQKIGERPVRHPDKATVIGPARVMPKELPGVTVRLVDVELSPAPGVPASTAIRRRLAALLDPRVLSERSPRERALELLWEDLRAAPATETVAYDGGRRWRQEHEAIALDREDEGSELFRSGGAYLITGGAGDISLAISEMLAERFKARLAFIGRTRLPDRPFWPSYLRMHGDATRVGRTIAAIAKLEERGAEVLYLCGDVSNPEDVRAAVARVQHEFGAINGVIHAAGTVDDNLLQLKTDESIEAVLAPKLLGAANLSDALRDVPLDLFVLFSSTSVATAPVGQIDYVAANAYLNALSSSQPGGGARRTIAIQWGVWAEIGMAARAVAGDVARTETSPAVGPLFERWVSENGVRWLEGAWGPATHWHLDEHRLATGEAIWPGTGYLEAAAQAMREHGFGASFEIEDLEFLQPLHVPDGKTRIVRVRLEPTKGGFAFELSSASEDAPHLFSAHAQARLIGAPMAPGRIDLGAVAARCGVARMAQPGVAIPAAQERHLRFGPRWRVLRSLALGRGEALATLELAQRFRSDHDEGNRLHAGLLDIATGYAMELIEGYDAAAGLWAPMSYGKARIFGDVPLRVHSWARLSADPSPDGYASFDVTLTDEDGDVVLEVERLIVRRLGSTNKLAEPGSGRAAASAATVRKPQVGASAALADQVAQGIRPGEGASAMLRAVGAGRSEIIVSSMDLDLLKRFAAAARPSSAAFERPELESEFVAPSTKAEKALAGLWSELLGVDKIGVHDDFFALGGHSLIAVRLFRMIKETFAVSLPISSLFAAPTIAQCAALLGVSEGEEALAVVTPESAGKPPFRHVVPMGGLDRAGQTPFFLCAGMFGNVLNLRHLALMLGADRPVYGLQARGLYGDLPPHETFEEMAEDYCRELREVQPEGPYLIGGFSGGGLTAYAMARRLTAEGEQVTQLVMLDTPLPKDTPLSFSDLVSMKAQDLAKQRGAFLKNWATKRVRWEAQRLMERFKAPAELPSEQFHDAEIEAAFYRALGRFVVQPYQGATILFRPRLQVAYALSGGRQLDLNRRLLADDNGWGPFTPRLTVVEAPGDHDSMVLEPNVRVLASHLRARLASAAPGDRTLFAAE